MIVLEVKIASAILKQTRQNHLLTDLEMISTCSHLLSYKTAASNACQHTGCHCL